MSDWSQQLAEELHKPITRNLRKRRVISYGIDKIWTADLVEIQKFSKWNKGVKYLLMIIDVFSKYGWIEPLKGKKTESVSSAFDTIFEKSKRKPEKLWTDKGSEFIPLFCITLKMKKNQVLLKDGIKPSKTKCGKCFQQTTILFIGISWIN